MGLGGLFRKLTGGAKDEGRLDLDELACRLGATPEELRAVRPGYREFEIPKRSGGARRIAAPEPRPEGAPAPNPPAAPRPPARPPGGDGVRAREVDRRERSPARREAGRREDGPED